MLLGKAYAQLGISTAAVEYLQKALRLQADVAEANGALGVIFWKQGRLAEAEAALRAELPRTPPTCSRSRTSRTSSTRTRGRRRRSRCCAASSQAKPDFADARYLLGKILLGPGRLEEAVEHLEAAARLAPEDANTHYQLGRAYTKARPHRGGPAAVRDLPPDQGQALTARRTMGESAGSFPGRAS